MAEDAFGIVGSVIASAYYVESVVAEGGFGTVYRAHHGGFRAPVALKCLRLPPGLLPEARQHFLNSFRAEAELLFRLSASIPTVVRPLHVDAFTLPDGRFVPYMVLEWLEGSTLDALIRKRRSDGQAPLSLKKLVRLLTPVARALERAHHFNGPDGPVSIVHRDLKPENIFVANVAGEEVVKILDFGIGKAKSMVSQVAGRASLGASGIATFTPAYGSPEQWAPKRYGQTGPWTDVWGLALTLTEGLVGHPLIDGDPTSIMGTILDPKQRPTPGSEGVIVSDEVEHVFEKALALDPRDRYPDAGVFWNELLAAARITSSGEMQEVRLPRDARAEPGGGLRYEHVDVGRRPGSKPVLPAVQGRPLLDLPQLPASAVGAAPNAAPVLRPLSPSPAPFPPAVSGSFEVPDLDLAPVSNPVPLRTSSGMRAAVTPSLELDEVAPLEMTSHASLDLDLRGFDSPGRSSQPPPRSSQPPLALSQSVPPVAVTTSAPPVSANAPLSARGAADVTPLHLAPRAPSPRASVPPTSGSPPTSSGSLPPVSRAGFSPGPVSLTPTGVEERHMLQIKLAPSQDATVLERLLPGAVVVGFAVLLTLLDQAYSVVSGEIFSIGPLRTSVLGALLMVVGVGICAYRLTKRP